MNTYLLAFRALFYTVLHPFYVWKYILLMIKYIRYFHIFVDVIDD